MSMQLGPIQGYIRLIDQFTVPATKIRNQMQQLANSGKMLQNSLGSVSAGSSIGQVAALGAAFTGLSIAVGAATRSYADFEKSMDSVGAIAEASTLQLQQMTSAALQLGTGAQFSANEVAKGMEDMARAGYSVQQTLDIMPTAMALAVAAQENLSHVSMVLARALATFGIEAQNASIVADSLTASANATNTSISNLAIGLRYVGPVAKVAGISIQDTTAAMGVLADSGLDASMAGTGLRRIFSELTAPTKKATEALKRMGLTLEDVDLPTQGIIGTLQQLHYGFAALPDDTARAGAAFQIFGDRGAPAILAIVNNLDRLREVTEEVRNSAGLTEKVQKEMLDNLAGDWAKFKNNLNDFMLAMGSEMNESLRNLVQAMTDLVVAMKSMAEPLGFIVSKFADLLTVVTEFMAKGAEPLKLLLVAITTAALAPMALGLVTAIKASTLLSVRVLVLAGSISAASTATSIFGGVLKAIGISNPFTAVLVAAATALFAWNEHLKRSIKESDAAMAAMSRMAQTGADLRAVLNKALGEPMKVKLIDVEDAEKQVAALVKAYQDALAALQKKYKSGDNVSTELFNLKEAQMQLERAGQALEIIRAAYDNYEGAAERKRAADLAAAQAAQAHADAIKEIQPKLESLIGKYDEVYRVTTDQEEGFKILIDSINLGISDAIENYNKVLSGMSEELGKAYAEQGNLNSALAAASIAFAAGRQDALSWQQALFAVWLASEEGKKALKDAEQAYKDAEKAAEDLRKEQERLAEQTAKELAKAYEDLEKLLSDTAGEIAIFEAMKKGAAAIREATIAADTAAFMLQHAKDKLEEGSQAWIEYEAAVRAAMTALYDVKNPGILDQLEIEMQKFKDSLEENVIRGLQSSMQGLFSDLMKGSGDALENFTDGLKNMFIDMLAEYLARLLALQLTAHLQEMGFIQAETAAKIAGAQAANAAGAGGGGGGGGMSALGGAGMWVAVAVAVGAIVKNIMDRNNAKEWGTVSQVEVSGGGITAGWGGKLDQTGPRIAEGIANLLKAFQDATGAFITGVMSAEVQIRNDKKWVEVFVNEQFVGAFSDINKAIIAAAKAVFLGGELSKTLDPIVRQVIEGYKGTDPEELAKAVGTVQEIMDGLSGLTDVEIALRDLPARAAQLAGELRNMGVSMEDAEAVAMKWRVQQMQTLRDQITGHQQTAAEQMAERQRQAAMFNAELALMRAELEMKRQELIAKGAVAQASATIAKSDIAAQQQKLMADGELLKARIDLENADINLRRASLETQAAIVGASTDLLNAQLAAIDAMIASLPTAIDMKEIRIDTGGGGGRTKGGGASGPSKSERRADVEQQLQDLTNQLLPDFVQQLIALRAQFSTLRTEMQALGMATAELDALEAQYLEKLKQQAMAEVAQYTQNPYQAAMAEILAWGAEMREVYTELGLSLEEVEAAERARIEDLIAQAEAALGLTGVDQQWLDMADALELLKQALADGTISAAEYAAALERAGQVATIALVDSLMAFVDDEQTKLAMEQLRWAMEIANLQLQFEYIKTLGILTKEQIAMVEELLGKAKEAGPPTGETGGGSAGGGMTGSGPRSVGDSAGDLAQAMKDLAKTLRDYIKSLKQDVTVSPYTLAQRFALAQQEWLSTIAEIEALTGPWDDDERNALIETLPDLAQSYLELAAQMWGTSSAGYQQIFQAVVDLLDFYATQLEEGATEWDDLFSQLHDFDIAFDGFGDSFDTLHADLLAVKGAIEDLEPVGDPGGGGGLEYRMAGMTTTGTRALSIEAVERAVRETGTLIAEEVCRTGDANNDELRAIRRAIERSERPSPMQRRVEIAAPRGRRAVA